MGYGWSRINALATSPGNTKAVEAGLKNAQTEIRMTEIDETHYVHELVNGDRGDSVCGCIPRRMGNVGSSSESLENRSWAGYTGRMILRNVTAMRHLFG